MGTMSRDRTWSRPDLRLDRAPGSSSRSGSNWRPAPSQDRPLGTLSGSSNVLRLGVPAERGHARRHGHYEETAESLATRCAGSWTRGWVNVSGVAAGRPRTTSAPLARLWHGRTSRVPAGDRAPAVSGISRCYERGHASPGHSGRSAPTVIGSRALQGADRREKFEEAPRSARAKVPGWAAVCLTSA